MSKKVKVLISVMVAVLLVVTGATVVMAQEESEDALIEALDRAVENECIAQEESTQIMEWWQQRPEVMNQIRLRRFCAPLALGQRYMWGGHGGGYGPGMFEPPAD